jgi:hypothetical protein
MKISGYIMMLLVVGAVFFIFAQMISEANENYPSTNINSSVWDSKYDFANGINNDTAPLQQAFSDIENPDKGWFSKLISGIAAIPWAVIKLPVILFSALAMGGIMVTGFLGIFGIPAYIVTVVLIMMVVWGIIKLIEAFHRWYL